MERCCVALTVIVCPVAAIVAAPSIPPAPDLTTRVQITASDSPVRMPAVKAFLSPRPADRLNTRWPDKMTQQDCLIAILNGKLDRLDGFWPFRYPAGDPDKVTKAGYLAMIKDYPGLADFEQRFGKKTITPYPGAYEGIAIFVAFYKATGDRKYLDMTMRAVRGFCMDVDREVAKHPTKPPGPGLSAYWRFDYAFIYLALRELEGTSEFKQMMAMVGAAVSKRANAWPIAPFHGAYNMAFDAAFWYDLAVTYGPKTSRSAELKAYADDIWHEWWDFRGMDEDDSWYSYGDMIILHAWCQLRGVKWWEDKEALLIWRQYAEQVANDGTWIAYGDGGVPGKYFVGLMISELAGRYLRDGRYRWLAQRAFWNGRGRIRDLCAQIGYLNQIFAAMAYLFADETVKPTPPSAGVTLTQRHWRDLTPSEVRLRGGRWFQLRKKVVPSKVVFRGGSTEKDDCLMLQAGQQGGHGHPDSGHIIHYGGNQAYYLSFGAVRLDNWLEAHNVFVLRDPKSGKYWPGRWGGLYTTEETRVPVRGQTSEAGYARLRIQEYPGMTATPELWKTVREWKKTWTLEKAIGYKNWPMRLDRCVLFVNNRFTVVRDVTRWVLPAEARMGANWTLGEIGTVGTHWVNAWTPKVLDGHFGYRSRKGGFYAPVYTAARDLLVWFAPKPDATLEIEKVFGDRSTTGCHKGAHYNLPLRAWYTRTGDWRPGQPQAFTTVLVPHDPKADAAALAASISAVRDDGQCTALRVADGDTVRLVVLNTSGQPVTVGKLATDAEAAMLTTVNGKPSHLSAWHTTRTTLSGKPVAVSTQAVDVDRTLDGW